MALADTELGPCRLVWGAGPDVGAAAQSPLGDDIGYTLGGTTLMIKTSSAEKKVDQLGTTIIDRVITGLPTVSVETALAEITPRQVARVFLGLTDAELTSLMTTNNNGFKVGLSQFMGKSMITNAKRLILKPIIAGVVTANEDDWISLPKAYPEMDMALLFNPETQRSFKVTFYGFPDENDSFNVVQFGRVTS